MRISIKMKPALILAVLLLVTGCGVAKGPSSAAPSSSPADPYQRDLDARAPLWSELSVDEAGLSGTTSPYPPKAGQPAELIVWFHYSYEYMPMDVAYRVADGPTKYDDKTGEAIDYNEAAPRWIAMKIVRVIQADYALRKDTTLDSSDDPRGRSNTVQVLTAPLNLPAGTHYLDFKVTYPTDFHPPPDHVPGWELTVE